MLKPYFCLGIIALSTSLLLEADPHPVLAFGKTTPQSSPTTGYYLTQARTYKVKLGDTLSGIALKTGVGLDQLRAYNSGLRKNPDLLQVGQVVYLSQPSSKSPNPTALKPSSRKSVQAFNTPSQRRTGGSRIGAKRGKSEQQCLVNADDNVRALLPGGNFGYTLQDYPTLFWYMPELKSTPDHLEVKISHTDAQGKPDGFHFKTYKFTKSNPKAEIMSLTLPSELGPLEEGKEYQWEVRLYCTDKMFITAQGNIKRLSLENLSSEDPKLDKKLEELPSKLEKVSVEDYPAILAEAGIWYDALSTLAGLREEKPTDPELAKDWTTLLQNIGFGDISSVPLLARETSVSQENVKSK